MLLHTIPLHHLMPQALPELVSKDHTNTVAPPFLLGYWAMPQAVHQHSVTIMLLNHSLGVKGPPEAILTHPLLSWARSDWAAPNMSSSVLHSVCADHKQQLGHPARPEATPFAEPSGAASKRPPPQATLQRKDSTSALRVQVSQCPCGKTGM